MAGANKRLPKGLSPRDIFAMKFETLPFEGDFRRAFGEPEKRGVWLMWGGSGSGKTSMAILLAKELAKHGKVAYNSLEQGASLSMREALERHKIDEVERGRFLLLSEDIETLSERLSKRKSPDYVIIDSFQYCGLSYKAYKQFKERHKDKLIVFISHAEGIQPAGRTAVSVQYDADMKIFVEGYRATSKGRFFGEAGACYVIWEEGASKYSLKVDNKAIKKV